MERVQDPHSPGFYSLLFLVQGNSGSWRPVIDLKVFNTFLLKPTFKMETLALIRNSIRPMHWGVSLDLEDAFFHVPIHPNFRKFLRFAFQGKVYQFWAMHFGLAIAPRVFTKLMAAVGAHLGVHGVLLLQYFDDWLLHQLDRQLLLRNLEFAWKELLSLGLVLNANKSDLIPSQDFTFVGMNFLTHLNQIRVSRQGVSDLIARVKWVLTQSHITLAVTNFQAHLQDLCVMLSTDNTSVVAYVQAQGGTYSLSLYLETRDLLVLCRDLNISLSTKHIPDRLNALADGLS